MANTKMLQEVNPWRDATEHEKEILAKAGPEDFAIMQGCGTKAYWISLSTGEADLVTGWFDKEEDAAAFLNHYGYRLPECKWLIEPNTEL